MFIYMCKLINIYPMSKSLFFFLNLFQRWNKMTASYTNSIHILNKKQLVAKKTSK